MRKNYLFALLGLLLFGYSKTYAQSLNFAGSNNRVETTYNLDVTNGFTVEYLLYINNLRNYNGTVSQGTNNLPGPLDVYITASGQMTAFYGDGSGLAGGGNCSFTFAAGTWYHIAHTYNPSTNTGKLYVNGTLIDTFSGIGAVASSGSILYLGTRADNATDADIIMQDVKVWTGEKTPTASTCLTGSETDLQVYYKMNEGTGTVLNDLATTDGVQDGNLIGALAWSSGITFSAPSVTIIADNTSIAPGATVTFSATASASITPPSYQWYKNGAPVGTDNSIYTDNTLADYDTISCVLTVDTGLCLTSATAGSNKIGVRVLNFKAALNFDGNDDYVSANSLLLTSTSNITMEAWVNWQGGSSTQRIFYNGNSGNSGYGLYLQNGQIMLLFGGVAFNATSVILPTNSWTHLALVNDGANWIVYMNGASVYSAPGAPGAPTGVTTIGGQPIGESFNGSIDEVRVWNIDRTQLQIQNAMGCMLTGIQSNLVANYNFNVGTPNYNNIGLNMLPDSSGNGNDGTLYNFNLTGTYSNWINDANTVDQPVSIAITSSLNSVPATGTYAVTYYATAVNSGAGNYQWMKNGSAITGANATSYTDNTITINDTISCSLVSTSDCAFNQQANSNKIVLQAWGTAQALAFDGNDDYVSVSTTNNIPVGNSSYTLEAWIKPNNMGTEGIIGWGNYGSTNEVNAFRLTNNGLVNYWWSNDLYASTPDLSGNWHHVAVTYDGTSRIIYLDGDSIASDMPGTNNVPNTANFGVGVTFYSEYFNGSMDEVRVWNVARTPSEIQDNMNCSLNATTGLVANYNFNEGIANADNTGLDSLIDNSGNSNLGLLNNFDLIDSTSNWTRNFQAITPSISIVEINMLNVANGGTASASDYYTSAPNLPADAFDGDIVTTGWGNNNALPAWLEYDLGAGNGKVVTSYSFYCASTMDGGWNSTDYDPTDWTFEGFNGTSWDILDSRVDNNPTQDIWNTYSFVNTTAYENYRININSTNDGGWAMITELKLLTVDSSRICSNKLFIATPNRNYLSSSYQWMVNGVNVGTNNDSLILNSFNLHDTVMCILNTTLCYSASVVSNNIVINTGVDASTTADLSTATVTANAVGATYQWINCGSGNAAIAGATNQSYTATANGSYAVVVMMNGCTDTSACVAINTVGIVTHAGQASDINVYPNPASDVFNIQLPVGVNNAIVEVYDFSGRIVLSEKTQNTSAQVDVTKLPNAIYEVRVISNGAALYQGRLVKQK